MQQTGKKRSSTDEGREVDLWSRNQVMWSKSEEGEETSMWFRKDTEFSDKESDISKERLLNRGGVRGVPLVLFFYLGGGQDNVATERRERKISEESTKSKKKEISQGEGYREGTCLIGVIRPKGGFMIDSGRALEKRRKKGRKTPEWQSSEKRVRRANRNLG